MLYNSISGGITIPARKIMRLLLGNDRMKWLRWQVLIEKEDR